jgi:hypothetical protein
MPTANYIEKLQQVEALQYTGTNGAEVDAWLPPEYEVKIIMAGGKEKLSLRTNPAMPQSKCWMEAGCWIAKHSNGVLELLYPEQFAVKYETVTT